MRRAASESPDTLEAAGAHVVRARLIASIALTAGAVALLVVLVLPGQDAALDEVEAAADRPGASIPGQGAARRLTMLTGLFNLLWATVTVLMIIRPGSTTGA